MAKIIKFNNIKIKEFSISEQDGKFSIEVVYRLVEENDTEWDIKRLQIVDKKLTTLNKKDILKVFNIMKTKVKTIEKI